VPDSDGASTPRLRQWDGGESAEPLRLADVLASLSLVADSGFGLPPDESMRSCLITTAVARRMGLGEAEVAASFYTALLEHVGCTGFAHETAQAYGDELVANAAVARTNVADPRAALATFLPAVSRGRGPLGTARLIVFELTQGSGFGRRFATATCEVGRETAQRLGLPYPVQRGLNEVYESWNGKGGSQGLKGDSISLPGRIARLGATVARFDAIGGAELAVDAVRRRTGGLLDPEIAGLFMADASVIVAEANAGDPHDAVLAAEPEPALSIPPSGLADVAAVIGDIVDLKSPFTLGHSGGVAALARGAAVRLGLDPAAVDRLHVAALLHDVGRVGVSNSIWERPGPLTSTGWEQVRLHAYHSERILARSTALRPMAGTAGMHHERLDGSGYHRGSKARELPLAARILAAADAYQAMTQRRPHRAALRAEEAQGQLRDELRAGRLDGDAAAAVLTAAGHAPARPRVERPAGLSEREIEVLRALARGATNREIARRFSISSRTAEHHVEHIYDKIGTSSRAAAALFAMEHDLLD
jgi:HD-GYP domain-containing protein (c-di-GMP phosphodiesterase class II)